MGWESFVVFRSDLGPLLQHQTRTAKPKSAYNYVHPTGGWTYYFCFFHRLASGVRRPVSGVRRPTWFPDILGNSSYPIFTKFGMQVYWVNSLHGIAFGDDSSIAN